jgi:chromatin remodeling complex protein RSC6
MDSDMAGYSSYEIAQTTNRRLGGTDMVKLATPGATKVSKAKDVKSATKSVGGAQGGLASPVTPSSDLAAIVGDKDLPRSAVVSKMWTYIKKHDLQDAKDRRQINADEKLAKIFGKRSVSMFEMNKLLSNHLTAGEPKP